MSNERTASSDAARTIVLSIILLVPLMIWSGFVIMTIWNWFVPGIFTSLPVLTFLQAIGLGLVFSAFSHRRTWAVNEKSPLSELLADVFDNVCFGLLLLVTGAVVHWLL